MRYLKLLSLAAAVVAVTTCAPEPQEDTETTSADLVLTNARVYTLNWAEPAKDGTAATGAPRSENGWHPDA